MMMTIVWCLQNTTNNHPSFRYALCNTHNGSPQTKYDLIIRFMRILEEGKWEGCFRICASVHGLLFDWKFQENQEMTFWSVGSREVAQTKL